MSASAIDPRAADIDLITRGPDYNGLGAEAAGDFVIIWLQAPTDQTVMPTAWIAISPTDAMQFGERVARCGHAAESKEDVYGKTPIVLEAIRKRLVVAITHLLKSDAERGSTPDMTAQRAVELALTELGT